jgi:cellulose synthase/poly-beta-1,6-N-acetylglucosamine synthase-like glycosyltransferase
MALLSPSDSWTGDYLVERGLITLDQYDEAADLVESWDASLSDVLMARRWITPVAYYKALAQRFDVDFVDLRTEPPDSELLVEAEVDDYMRELVIPWRRRGGRLVVATARPGPEAMLYIRRRFGREVDLVITAKFDILWSLQKAFASSHSHRAVYELADTDPEMSAQIVFTRSQIVTAWAMLTALLAGLAVAPVPTLIVLNALMSVFYLGNFMFKGVLVWAGGQRGGERNRALEAEARLLRDEDLPDFTILVPMFREPEVLPILAGALRKLHYPLAKLDIKIVLEEGDHETIEAAKQLGLEGIFEIVRVPASQPQTKPKACNYALRYARGDYLVIYDAEDKPEPDQLRKVVAAFRRSDPSVACIQCRLNYYNASENWLTRMFTLDYSLWFDLMLPGLERLGIPIPLGGTSNHFKTSVLRELRAWDPFNVTEDADLGIRMTQKGCRVGLIDSTTFEEANVSQSNWVRQRSRWMKGYMQTCLVHLRRPLHLMRSVGPLGTLGFVSFIGGTVLSGLLNPIFWGVFTFWLITQTSGIELVFPPVLLYFSLLNLLLGNAMFIYLMMLAPFRRKWVTLAPYALTVFWYWVLLSVAAWKGAWQLITNPFYWEKTQHGISKHTAAEVAAALQPDAA